MRPSIDDLIGFVCLIGGILCCIVLARDVFGHREQIQPTCHAIAHTGQTFRVVFGKDARETGAMRCYQQSW